MSVVLSSAEQRVVLHNVSWETYERILSEHVDSRSPRFTFENGELEIMSPSAERERYIWLIGDLVGVLADVMDLDAESLGSTTFRREEHERGFEPDCCFYFENAVRVRGKDRLDLSVDPPPDLVVEVDVTNPSIAELPIFAEFGVAEVWRVRQERRSAFRLRAGQYQEVAEARSFQASRQPRCRNCWVEVKTLGRTAWLRLARAWAQEHYAQ